MIILSRERANDQRSRAFAREAWSQRAGTGSGVVVAMT
jgi:hypothetical protein